MTSIRQYCPEIINENLWFYIGKTLTTLQYYSANEFNADEVYENIFVGGMNSSMNKDELKNNITHIISLINGYYEIYPDDFNYKVIHINDDKWVKIKNYFNECNEFIQTAINNGGKVLIHCKFGASRSITIALAYMIYKNKIKPEKLIEQVKQKEKEANPNDGFIDQLNDYYNELYKNNIE